MSMKQHSMICAGGVLALTWATGCADPCVDDGLSQAPESNCPVATGGGSTTDSTDPDTADTTASGGGGDCNNGIQDGDETDVDCGGSCGPTCGGGQGCGGGDDCMSGECGDDMTCDEDPGPSDCADGVMNGSETDVDCGGPECDPCNDGDMCLMPSDCVSEVCERGTCGGSDDPSCRDGMMNGNETDVDCGGPECNPCENGEMCIEGSDCESQNCTGGVCVDPCNDGMMNGGETDVDCGGPDCDRCENGEMCIEDDDCMSQICSNKSDLCAAPSCNDGVMNGDETDLDCGGMCGDTCEPGQDCLIGGDCISQGCDNNVCNDYLSVDATPACSAFAGMPVPLSATAMGGSGMYMYSWTPNDGTLSAPDQAMTDASPAGFQTYTVTVDDGFNMVQDDVVVVDSNPFDLQNNCSLYTADFNVSSSGLPADISYDMGGTRACELGNNEFGLHLCEGVSFQNTRLQGVLEVVNDPGDDNDWLGLVWGAQDNSHFYSMTWKQTDQLGDFSCPTPGGIIVRRIDAPSFASLTLDDWYCEPNTPRSELLAGPTMGPVITNAPPWIEGESYTVTIDFTDLGSDITIVQDSNGMQIAAFTIADNTYTSGFFGSTTASQEGACAGPLFAECL